MRCGNQQLTTSSSPTQSPFRLLAALKNNGHLNRMLCSLCTYGLLPSTPSWVLARLVAHLLQLQLFGNIYCIISSDSSGTLPAWRLGEKGKSKRKHTHSHTLSVRAATMIEIRFNSENFPSNFNASK